VELVRLPELLYLYYFCCESCFTCSSARHTSKAALAAKVIQVKQLSSYK
jgi:hypothetical protein